MLHHFFDDYHPKSQGAISQHALRQILTGLGVHRFLTPAEWLTRSLAGELHKDDLCITLDDALLCQYDVALPVLDELGLKAFWFVYSSVFEGTLERLEVYRHFRSVHFSDLNRFYDTFSAVVAHHEPAAFATAQRVFDPTEYLKPFAFYSHSDRWFRYLRDEVLGGKRYNELMDRLITDSDLDTASLRDKLWMTNSQLARLVQEGHMVGLHSTTHPTRLERLSAEQQAYEYGHNLDHIFRATGVRPQTMSHPCNSYGAETLEILRGLGIQLGFRSNMALAARHGPLEYPREDQAMLKMITA